MTIRSYTNSKGELVQVSKEHLDAAVEIKLELQEASIGRKTNWNTHKNMMIQQGFEDSDKNEAYRCLVKSFQKEINKLRKVDSYADYVADGKLEAIKQSIGEIYHSKKDSQAVIRELNKIKTDFSKSITMIEEVRNVFLDDAVFNFPKYEYIEQKSSPINALLLLSDFHIGLKTNSWDLSVAKKQIKTLTEKTINDIKLFNIGTLYVSNLADTVEGMYMRNNQPATCELNFSEQINEAVRLLMGILVDLSQFTKVVFLGSCIDNHSRMNGDKNFVADGDNANIVIDGSIETFIKMANMNGIDSLSCDYSFKHHGDIVINLNGKNIKMLHGQHEQKTGNIKKHISLDNTLYDYIIMGHLHSFAVIDENHGRKEIRVGCLPTGSTHSRSLGYENQPSQAIMIFTEDEFVKPIYL